MYLKAFLLLTGSREIEKGEVPKIKNLRFSDILDYIREFPEDVDDKRKFIRMIQAIDEEFLKHGIGKRQTQS